MKTIIPKRYVFVHMIGLANFGHNYNIKFSKNQTGGSVIEKIFQYDHNNKIYSFHTTINDNHGDILIVVSSKSEKECITILISKDSKDAILQNLSYYKDCAKEGLKKPGGGTILLKFICKYLTKYKKKYGIDKIVLTDNSFIYCKKCPTTTKLARLKMITDEYTWYGKHGFLPYDTEIKRLDKKMKNQIYYNKKILLKLKTKNVNILKLIKCNKIKCNLKEINRLVRKYPLMKTFIIRLYGEFDKYCCIINYILEEIYNPIVPYERLLNDMYGKTFYLKL